MPEHNESPDEHVARCWMESFIDVGLVQRSDSGYEKRIESIKTHAVSMAVECSNSNQNMSEKLDISCHPSARNPGLFFGYMCAVKDMLDILGDWE